MPTCASGGRGNLANRVVFPVGEEEQLVLDDRTTDLATVPVFVKARVKRGFVVTHLRQGILRILRIQFAIVEVVVRPAVKLVAAALDRLVELAARRVAKFR